MNKNLVIISSLVRGLYGLGIGALFSLLQAEQDPKWIAVYGIIGFLIAFLSRWVDAFLYQTQLRRQRFMIVLLIRSLIYFVLFVLSVGLVLFVVSIIDPELNSSEVFRYRTLREWLSGGEVIYNLLYSFLILLALQFVVLVLRLVGPSKVLNYLLGKYNEPIEEERIFMFMDLRSSTTIAERLGHVKWHQFLNDFFYDIARPVRRSQGEIYQYVGDEAVISWPKATGLKRLNCIRCFFWIYDLMEKRRSYYLKTYGFEPIFKSGYHVGKVIVGEIGDFKRDIVFHGDVVNTASRIQAECNARNRRLLLSSTLLQQLNLGREYTAEYIDKMVLRGKQEEIELYSLDPIIPGK